MTNHPYPYLPENKSFKFVPADNPFLQKAYEMVKNASCYAHPTGGALVCNDTIIATGSNAGILRESCPRRDQGYKTGTGYHLCKSHCNQFGHSEPNTLYHALKNSGASKEDLERFGSFIEKTYDNDYSENFSGKMQAEISKFFDEMRQKGIDFSDCDFYLEGHWWVCEPCWTFLIGASIRDVYLREDSLQRYKK